MQAAEIEHLKTRLKQYGNYEEIKRELYILKVRRILGVPALLTLARSPSSSQALMTIQRKGNKSTAMLRRNIALLLTMPTDNLWSPFLQQRTNVFRMN
jgi:hypothetical protein